MVDVRFIYNPCEYVYGSSRHFRAKYIEEIRKRIAVYRSVSVIKLPSRINEA